VNVNASGTQQRVNAVLSSTTPAMMAGAGPGRRGQVSGDDARMEGEQR